MTQNQCSEKSILMKKVEEEIVVILKDTIEDHKRIIKRFQKIVALSIVCIIG